LSAPDRPTKFNDTPEKEAWEEALDFLCQPDQTIFHHTVDHTDQPTTQVTSQTSNADLPDEGLLPPDHFNSSADTVLRINQPMIDNYELDTQSMTELDTQSMTADDGDTHPELAILDSELIAQKTKLAFKVGDKYADLDALKVAVDQFALENHFTVRKSRGRSVVCSRAKNWNSVQKEKNDLTSMKKSSSMECACPWAIVLSRSNKKTYDDDDRKTIAIVEPKHNHLCNIALAARSRKSSGT
jgi:hypothetical protein